MKARIISICMSFALFLLISCTSSDKGPIAPKPETPEALQDKTKLTDSYSRGYSNYVNDLYDELVQKRADLKKLEEDLVECSKQTNEAQKVFNDFDGKSKKYYADAKQVLYQVKDSLLRKRMEAIVEQSQKAYDPKVSNLTALLKQSISNAHTIQDYHQLVKVALTLPMIEQYQNANMPDKKDLENANAQQGKLIERMDSVTFKK